MKPQAKPNSIRLDRFEVIQPKVLAEWRKENSDPFFEDAINGMELQEDFTYTAPTAWQWSELAAVGAIRMLANSASFDCTDEVVGRQEVTITEDGIKWIGPNPQSTRLVCGDLSVVTCNKCGHSVPFLNKIPSACSECASKGSLQRLYPPQLDLPLWLPAGTIQHAELPKIYEGIREFAKQHLVLSDPEYDVLSLWIISSYLVDDFDTCPYLAMTAPMSSGKSQVLEVIRQLAYRAYGVVDATQSALFRAITQSHITLCIDEVQDSMNLNTEHGAAIKATMLSGYKRGMGALRNDDSTGAWIPANFDLFGFKAFSGTDVLAPALASRAIEFKMRKAKPKNIRIDRVWAEELRGFLMYWRFHNLHKVPTIDPDIDDGRLIEIFSPLYSVAPGLDCDGLPTMLEATKNTNRADEQQSIESEIAMIILEMLPAQTGGFNVRTTIAPIEIVDALGWDPTRGSTVKIGRRLKLLGLPTTHTRMGNVIDLGSPAIQTQLEYLRQRYGV